MKTNNIKNNKIIIKIKAFYAMSFICLLVISGISDVVAATSTNYLINVQRENAGDSNLNSSANYGVGCSEFGKIGEGIIISGSYSVSANLPCETLPVGISFRFAPEKRVQTLPFNLNMQNLQISFRAVGSSAFSTPIAVSSVASSTDVSGYSINPVIITAAAGSYDVFIKSGAHLNQKYGTINYTGGPTTLDFTQGLTKYARAGDVNGSQFGDDEINALDISVTIAALGGSAYRPDTNQDSEVNALDIGILLANLNQIGE
jgi:hypothetical protein